MDPSGGDHWTGSWATTPDPVEEVTLSGQTVRIVAHVSLGGVRLRVRLSNAYGSRDLRIGAAHVGLRAQGARLAPGSERPVTFGGSPQAVIPAGAPLVSDPVRLDVAPFSDVAVSAYLPDELGKDFRITGHNNGHQTNYVSEPGDFASGADFPVGREVDSYLVVSGVEVETAPGAGGVVAFGDSLTEGNLSTLDANVRWPDQLARRLAARGGRPFGVVNQGIGGNRMLHDGRGDSALRRFDRDVLAQPGVTHVVVLLGVNDLRNSSRKPEEVVSAAQMSAGLQQLALRARGAGLKVYGATLLTWEHETFKGGAYTPEGEAKRQAVNAWIREGRAFDAVIDFEAALRDPDHPTRMLPRWDSGDHLHPSDAGYLQMADSINLSLFV